MAKKALQKTPKKAELNVRQAKILAAIVKEYSHAAQPVGSEDLNAKYGFGVSSATIRSEMVALEKMGYIEQPHTSAGRVPTDLGYRYFVNQLMKRFELSLQQQQFLKNQLAHLQQEHQEMGRSIAKLLATQTDQAAFALLPEETSAAGLANILAQPGSDQKSMVEVAEFFDNIDGYANKMLTDFLKARPEALIGKEHRLPQIANYSLIVSKVSLASGKKGIIGIIGPKSMRYDRNMTLVEYVAKILSGSTLLVLLLKF